jgi:hypothetical protein
MTTTKELPQLLAERDPARYKSIISKALAGVYHDYKSEEAMPKVRLVNDLSIYPELYDIREAVIRGDYDEDLDNIDKDTMRQDLLSEGVGDALFTALGLDIPTADERLTGRVQSKN